MQNEAPKSEYDDIAIAQVDDYVNVRSTAGEDGEVLGKLYNNSACTVLGTEGDWYKIHSGDVEGYIKAEFLVLGNAELSGFLLLRSLLHLIQKNCWSIPLPQSDNKLLLF